MMMKGEGTQAGTALLVHCHSESDSFVTAMRDVISTSLQGRGYRILHSDLYRMGFDPVLSPEDFSQRKDRNHLVYALEQRHGYETGTLAHDVLGEIEKIRQADLVVFTFPLFWYSLPAMLKGWIDRVFISGVFYGGKRIYDQGGMAGKRAFAAFSLGGAEPLFGEAGIHGKLTDGLMRHFFQGTLGYTGFSVIEPFIAWHAPYLSTSARVALLNDLAHVAESLDQRTVLRMPLAAQLLD